MRIGGFGSFVCDGLAPVEDNVIGLHDGACDGTLGDGGSARMRSTALACHYAATSAEHLFGKLRSCLPLVVASFLIGAILSKDLYATKVVCGYNNIAIVMITSSKISG